MQLNENAVVFESADAGYAACTGPAAAATSAAAPTRAARERSHRPGDIPGPPPAGNVRVAERSGCRRGGECRKSGGLPFTRPYRPAPRRRRTLAGGPRRRCAASAGGRTRATLLPVTTPPRGREAGEIPAQSRYGDRRSRNGGSPVAGPAAEPHVPSRERAGRH